MESELVNKTDELKRVQADVERVIKYERLSVNEQVTLGLNKDLAEVKEFMRDVL
jgi:hypothetical protein